MYCTLHVNERAGRFIHGVRYMYEMGLTDLAVSWESKASLRQRREESVVSEQIDVHQLIVEEGVQVRTLRTCVATH